MPPQTILLLINTSLTVLNELLPELQKLRASGEVSVEDQQKVLDAVAVLRSKTPLGPEWQV